MRRGRGDERMFDAFKSFVADLTSGEKHPSAFDDNDDRLAVAALLLHAAAIDGDIDDAERNTLHTLLKQRFALDDAATDKLIAAATTAEHDAVDLFHFTHVLNRSLDEEGRLRFVEMMWQVVFADGRPAEFEENLIWRAADLLGVSSRERIALRQRVTSCTKLGE
jgi:uncharacterized tellurite resistance protein B-like protein